MSKVKTSIHIFYYEGFYWKSKQDYIKFIKEGDYDEN